MEVVQKKNHLFVTLVKTEFVIIRIPKKKIRLVIENGKDKVYINHFEQKKV